MTTQVIDASTSVMGSVIFSSAVGSVINSVGSLFFNRKSVEKVVNTSYVFTRAWAVVPSIVNTYTAYQMGDKPGVNLNFRNTIRAGVAVALDTFVRPYIASSFDSVFGRGGELISMIGMSMVYGQLHRII